MGEARPEVKRQQMDLAAADPERQALAHCNLYQIYMDTAGQRPVISMLYRLVASHHIREAAESKVLPGPLSIRAVEQVQEGDFWSGIENLSEAIVRQRVWLGASERPDQDRLALCRYLNFGGQSQWQIGGRL